MDLGDLDLSLDAIKEQLKLGNKIAQEQSSALQQIAKALNIFIEPATEAVVDATDEFNRGS